MMTESLSDFFGTPDSGDPYLGHDDIAGRFYVLAIDGLNRHRLLFAVSDTSIRRTPSGNSEHRDHTAGGHGRLPENWVQP